MLLLLPFPTGATPQQQAPGRRAGEQASYVCVGAGLWCPRAVSGQSVSWGPQDP